MLRRTYTIVLAVTLLFTTFSYAQTYQGPQQGSVSSGAVVNTNSFPDFPISGNTDPVIRGEMNIEGFNNEPLFIEPDGNAVFPTTYVEDLNVGDNPDSVGNNAMLLQKFYANVDNNVIPPDPTIAVGPNHVMVLTNNSIGIRIYDKQGTLLKSINTDQWFSAVWPSSGGDPQILYDHFSNRWFMLYLEQDDVALTASNLIAYSDDDDPLGTWYMYRLDTKTHGTTPSTTWGDYPQIGFDEQAIYIMTRCFGFTGGLFYNKIRIISKAELYASNAGPLTYNDIWDITLPGSGLRPDVIHPSFQYSAAGEHYLLYASRSGAEYYGFYKITNPITAPVLTGVNIFVPAPGYGAAPDANQLGGGTPLIAVNGSHMKTSPVFRDGYLYAVHSIRNSVYTAYGSIKYIKIDVATQTIVESAELGADKYFYFYPAIAVDKDGNVGITCSRSGDTEYAGAYFTTRRATDPPGLGNSGVLQPGLGNYVITFGGTRNRWGDYLGVFLDPADEYSFWMVSEFASGTNAYDCVIGQVRLEPFPGKYAFRTSDSLAFGNVEINTISDTLQIIVANYGTDDLVISDIASDIGPFTLIPDQTFPQTLQTFDSLTVRVIFSPTVVGAYAEVLSITSSDTSLTGIRLTGNSYEIIQPFTNIFYASSGAGNNGDIITIDRVTGAGTTLGSSLYSEIKSLTIDHSSNILYGLVSLGVNSEIVRVNADLGDSYTLFTLDIPSLSGIDFDTSGTLYVSSQGGDIYSIDQTNGNYTLVTSVGLELNAIAFNPTTNELWGARRVTFGLGKDSLYTIDLTTGAATPVGKTGFGASTNDMAFDEADKLYGVRGVSNQAGKLFEINQVDGVGTLIGTDIGFNHTLGLAFSINGIINSVDGNESAIPDEFALKQNYPNPFNPNTKITFSLPVNSNVKIIVYNLLGEVVRELTNTDMSAGIHSVQWNADDISGKKVSSGIYFYELSAAGVNGNQFNQVRKMVLLK